MGVAMPKEIIRELVYRAYEAYELGHRDFIVDILDDDIDWTFHGPADILPIPNHLHGRAAVLDASRMIDDATELLSHKLNLVLVDGEHVAALGEHKFRHRLSGRIVQYKFAAFHLYRNARLVEYHMFVDTLGMAEQLLGNKVALAAAYPR
jgi:ketosteroid isomerase-like protein